MKSALISPNEPSYTGERVAQVVEQGQTFPVGDPCFWMDCADDVVADQFYYDPATQAILPIPAPESEVGEQPTVTGAQTL